MIGGDDRLRKCQGPHGWCGLRATVVCTAADRLQWFACDRPEHQRDLGGAPAAAFEPIGPWFARVLRDSVMTAAHAAATAYAAVGLARSWFKTRYLRSLVDEPQGGPQITFHPGRDGNGYPMNHAQWEVFKREADAAWALYETTWPAEAEEPTQGG